MEQVIYHEFVPSKCANQRPRAERVLPVWQARYSEKVDFYMLPISTYILPISNVTPNNTHYFY